MGITRMGDLKHTKSGARQSKWRNKRNFLKGRPSSQTRIGEKRIHPVRVRGGQIKMRALRLDTGTFSWASKGVTRKTKILNVVYHAANNDFVRTNTLAKGSIVLIDASPFAAWYEGVFGEPLGKREATGAPKVGGVGKIRSRFDNLDEAKKVEDALLNQFNTKHNILACVSSRPGQCGRADGYILEGAELAFYQERIKKKKSNK